MRHSTPVVVGRSPSSGIGLSGALAYGRRVDRDSLAGLLAAGQGEAYEACLEQVRRGARFVIYDGASPASHYQHIYRRREQHTRRHGLPTVGFRETVERLRDLGEQPVVLGAVDVAFPPYHYQLFVSADLSTMVGCLGVDQEFQFTRGTPRLAVLASQAVAWVADDFPGWTRVRLVDADGRAWFFVDKVPVFTAGVITADTQFPVLVGIRCRILASESDGQVLVVSVEDGMAAEDGTTEFRVRRDQVRDRP
jgi:hypothetical protein